MSYKKAFVILPVGLNQYQASVEYENRSTTGIPVDTLVRIVNLAERAAYHEAQSVEISKQAFEKAIEMLRQRELDVQDYQPDPADSQEAVSATRKYLAKKVTEALHHVDAILQQYINIHITRENAEQDYITVAKAVGKTPDNPC